MGRNHVLRRPAVDLAHSEHGRMQRIEAAGDERELQVGDGFSQAVALGALDRLHGTGPSLALPTRCYGVPSGAMTDTRDVLPWRRRRPRDAGAFLSPAVRTLRISFAKGPPHEGPFRLHPD